MKRKISIVLALAILANLLFTFNFVSYAEFIPQECGDNAVAHLQENGVLTITGTGNMRNFSNGDGLYGEHKPEIKKIIISDGITGIGDYAFCRYINLEDVVIPDSVTTIGKAAFDKCENLSSIVIPANVTSIGQGAFLNCTNLKTITLNDGLTTIGMCAFGNSGLENAVIPETVTSLGMELFLECDNLKSVKLPEKITTITSHMFSSCKSLTDIVIPDSVTTIEERAFVACESLTDIVIPESVTNIGRSAFQSCESLTSITIPDSVTTIGDYAFSCCSKLANVKLSESITSIGAGTLNYTDSLTSIVIPEGVTTIGEGAFSPSGLKSITMPKSVTSIGKYAFHKCKNHEIYYAGTEEEWENISIAGYFDTTIGAEVHFNKTAINDEPAVNDDTIKVLVNGKKVVFDQEPFIEEGRTLVPLRAIFEALDAKVDWNGETATVTATKGDIKIELKIGSKEMKVGEDVKVLDVPAKIVGDRTVVPVRAISEAFGCDVDWDEENRTVIVNE